MRCCITIFSFVESMKGSLTGHSLEILSSKKHFELLYNIGVTLLYCNQPHLAFDCLLNVVQAYPFNPRLWLRLAECCTQVYKQVDILVCFNFITNTVCLNPVYNFTEWNCNFISRGMRRMTMPRKEGLSLLALPFTEKQSWVLAFDVTELSEP